MFFFLRRRAGKGEEASEARGDRMKIQFGGHGSEVTSD